MSVLLNALLHLEEVVKGIFYLAMTINLITYELSRIPAPVVEFKFASANSPVSNPRSFIHLTVGIITGANSMSSMVAISTFVISSILKHDFDPS